MTPKFLAQASGRMELPFTELSVGGTGLEEGKQELYAFLLMCFL